MICGQRFRGDLEEVQTPDGETVRCCARCKQLIDEATGVREHDREAAFETLGLSPGASQSEIKQAYRERVQQVHPDQGGSREEFKAVQEAYELLVDQ